MKFIGIIPARYASTRFPGKPLADMKGKYMIQRLTISGKFLTQKLFHILGNEKWMKSPPWISANGKKL